MDARTGPIRRGGYRGFALAVAGAVVALVTAACGSSSGGAGQAGGKGSGDAAGVAAASAFLGKHTGASAITAPGPAFDASKARGKLVELVTQQAANPAVATVTAALKAGLGQEGVTVQSCDAQGASVQISSCIRQGLAQKANAVDVVGGDPAAYSDGLRAAQAAHVPVFSALDVPLPGDAKATGADPSALMPKLQGLAGNAAPPDPQSGKLEADFITKDSQGSASVLFIGSPGIVGSDYLQKAFLNEMKRVCGGCSVETKNVTITNWASDLAPVVTAELTKNPKINYVVPVFDPMANYTDPAIKQLGKSGAIKVVTANGSLQQMEQLAQKDPVLVCEIGQDLPQLGYIAADQTLRKLAGAQPAASSSAQVRVFTSSNINSIDATASAFRTGQWYTGSAAALKGTFGKLWSGRS